MMSRIVSRVLLLLVGLASSSGVLAYEIETIEPPFWWQGMEHKELQLLVHGDGVGRLTPSVDYPGVSVNRFIRVQSPNYLFVDRKSVV